jgi:glutaconate CoA-transferase subunit A
VWAPLGAHPCAFDYFYDYDTEHIAFYVEQAKDPETFRRYLDKYVRGPKDHGEYLNLVGPTERLLRLQTAEAFLL